MNRKQRRKLSKYMKKKDSYFDILKHLDDIDNNKVLYEEGESVKLNYESITSQPDYQNMNPKYIEFVETHKNDAFTVEYDLRHKENPTLVCLKEDQSDPKWLWWVEFLIKI
jgi:hypothetical protein